MVGETPYSPWTDVATSAWTLWFADPALPYLYTLRSQAWQPRFARRNSSRLARHGHSSQLSSCQAPCVLPHPVMPPLSLYLFVPPTATYNPCVPLQTCRSSVVVPIFFDLPYSSHCRHFSLAMYCPTSRMANIFFLQQHFPFTPYACMLLVHTPLFSLACMPSCLPSAPHCPPTIPRTIISLLTRHYPIQFFFL